MPHSLNPIAILKRDHRTLATMLVVLETASAPARRCELRTILAANLETHAITEEATVYAALEEIDPRLAEHASWDHALLDVLVEDLLTLDPDDPQFGLTVGTLRSALARHVLFEEGDLLPQVAAALGEGRMRELAMAMHDLRAERRQLRAA
jgi:hemerythrin superfamily protein